MNHSVPSTRSRCALRFRQLRQQAGLSQAELTAISGVSIGFVSALEKDALCTLISVQEIQQAVARSDGTGPQRLMQRTLMRWAEALHQLADALADTFENLFPADELAALSDHLWLKIQRVRDKQAVPDQPSPVYPDNPWHDWGWFRNVTLLDDLPAELADDPAETCDLEPTLRALLVNLGPRERLVLTLHYGLDGPDFTLDEIGQQLGFTREEVRRLEHRALRHLKRPKSSRRLRDYLDCFN